MQFELTEEQKAVQAMAREFADNEVKPRARAIDHNHEFPHDLVKKMAELGLLGVAIPEKWGGGGLDAISYVLAMEEISRACASTGVIMSVNNSLVCDPIYKFGDDAQREKFLKPLASGKKLGCFALSEPDIGSDVAGLKTVAVRDGDFYVLNGTKNWITNGREADVVIVFATTDREAHHKGVTAFIVEATAPGYSVAKLEDKLGINGSSTASLSFTDVRIPVSQRLGNEGDGFKIAMSTLDGGRIGIASQANGISRAALDEALAYAQERAAFGKPIASFQGLQFMMADMATQLDAARLLTLRAAYMKDKGQKHSKESAMAKLYSSETSAFVTTKALQIHGGYGYVKDFNAERYFRDARITEIYEGTSEIQRIVIASNILKESAARLGA